MICIALDLILLLCRALRNAFDVDKLGIDIDFDIDKRAAR